MIYRIILSDHRIGWSTCGKRPFTAMHSVAIPSLFLRLVLFLTTGALEKFILLISKICTCFMPASLFCLTFEQFCENTITKSVI